jgi:membrane protease subunit (stomatin/prohibitin family)
MIQERKKNMLEGWEWIIIIGGIAFSMFVVLIVALLLIFTRHKTNTPQDYAPQQYSQQPQAQYNPSVNRFCPQCGKSIDGNAKFCSNCGKQLN